MDDVLAFLRARLDEDELTVREANTSPEMVTGVPRSYAEAPVAIHIARFADPARVLREVEARRRIVDRYAWLREHGDTGDMAWVLPLLAAAYVDHPDYRPEWAPTT